MDFQAAMETFAEAWVAANTPTAVNSDPSQNPSSSSQSNDPPTMLPKEKPTNQKTSVSGKGAAERKSPSPSGGAKSLPIHCVVEQVSGVPSFESTPCQSVSVELDSYAILPSTTNLCDLVRTALMKLGYSSSETMNAKGAIQLKNWKPLTFEHITDNFQATVDDILGDLTNVATLKIRICSLHEVPVQWTDQTVRCAVVELLQEMNQPSLAAISPLSQSVISNISNGKYSNKICRDKCEDFGRWYTNYRTDPNASQSRSSLVTKDSRLTFHPEHEVPLMRQWYKMCRSPSLEKLEFYTKELNRGHVRQARPKINSTRLKNWWKNERQKEKREQTEGTPREKRVRQVHLVRNLINLDNGSQVNVHDESVGYFAVSDSQSVYR